ncbi:hypothetical protein Droror1_Dr00025291, partial [Drosera rotundifolia]
TGRGGRVPAGGTSSAAMFAECFGLPCLGFGLQWVKEVSLVARLRVGIEPVKKVWAAGKKRERKILGLCERELGWLGKHTTRPGLMSWAS